MKDELRNFIQDNRASFDDKEAPPQVWTKVQQQLFGKTVFWQPIRYWQVAATLFFGLSTFLLLQDKLSPKQQLAGKEFAQTEAFYAQQIAEKTNMIYSINDSDLNGLTQDFQQLEAMYMVLKEEMKQRPSEQVKDALILNMLVRINLLNKQLQKLDETRQEKKSDVIS